MFSEELINLLKQELNVKRVEFIEEVEGEYVAMPNYAVIGPKFGKLTPQVAQAIKELSQDDLIALKNGKSVTLKLK